MPLLARSAVTSPSRWARTWSTAQTRPSRRPVRRHCSFPSFRPEQALGRDCVGDRDLHGGEYVCAQIMNGVDSLVLASASPQRRAILERLGVSFTVRATNVEEIEQGEPEQVAVENALLKARAAHTAAGMQETVLGVDTLVALGTR